MNTQDLLDKIRLALNELSPAMIVDGGGVEMVSLEAKVVTLKLIGSCEFCPSRESSSNALRRGLKKRVPELTAINIVNGHQNAPAFSATVKHAILNSSIAL